MVTHMDAYERMEPCHVCKHKIVVLYFVNGGNDDEDLDIQPEGRICGECHNYVHHGCADVDMCFVCARADQDFAPPATVRTLHPPRRVWFNAHLGMWCAHLKLRNGKFKYLGAFSLEEFAIKAYDRAFEAYTMAVPA